MRPSPSPSWGVSRTRLRFIESCSSVGNASSASITSKPRRATTPSHAAPCGSKITRWRSTISNARTRSAATSWGTRTAAPPSREPVRRCAAPCRPGLRQPRQPSESARAHRGVSGIPHLRARRPVRPIWRCAAARTSGAGRDRGVPRSGATVRAPARAAPDGARGEPEATRCASRDVDGRRSLSVRVSRSPMQPRIVRAVLHPSAPSRYTPGPLERGSTWRHDSST